jgi:hypothetical protein
LCSVKLLVDGRGDTVPEHRCAKSGEGGMATADVAAAGEGVVHLGATSPTFKLSTRVSDEGDCTSSSDNHIHSDRLVDAVEVLILDGIAPSRSFLKSAGDDKVVDGNL